MLARALVYMPEEKVSRDGQLIEPAHLRRLTIRYQNTELDYDYLKMFPEMQNFSVATVEQYRWCLARIKTLPVLDLQNPLKTWPVPAPGRESAAR